MAEVQSSNGILKKQSLGAAMVGFAVANPLVKTQPVGFKPELTAFGQGSGVYRHVYWNGGFALIPGGSLAQTGLAISDFLPLMGRQPRLESMAELAGDAAGQRVGELLNATFAGSVSAAQALQGIQGELCATE